MSLFSKLFQSTRKNQRGQALIEYAIVIAGVALVSLAAVSILGHKTNDMVASVAAVLPGAHTDDNAPIQSGHLVETATTAAGNIAIDTAGIAANTGTSRLSTELGADMTGLVQEP